MRLFVMFFILISYQVIAQEIKIIALDNPEVALNGTTVEVVGNPSDALVYKEFRIINERAYATDFYYRRKRLMNSGAVDQICDDFLCHDVPNQDDFTTGVPNPTNPNDSAIFKPQIIPNGEQRCAIHEYYVVSQFGVIYDSVRVKFIVGDVNCVLNVPKIEQVVLNIYPNPASEYIVVNVNSSEKRELIVKDALGKIVLRKWVTNEEKIAVTNLHNGIYFASIVSSSGSILSTRKLIIKQD